MYKTDCRGCGKENLRTVVSLGLSPLANNLLESKIAVDRLFPLEMKYCTDCHNCQLSYVVPAKEMFDNYLYVSSTAKSFRQHFENAANQYIDMFQLNENSVCVDIGSNDGIALRPLKEKNIKVVGVEPAQNIAKLANEEGIYTINEYFTQQTVDKILQTHGEVDVVTASNVFAHADALDDITMGVFRLLKKGGSFIVEVQYLLNTIKDLTFDNIYHEHVNYWSVISINSFFNRLGFTVYKVEHINTHGGSIRVYVKRRNETGVIDESVNFFVEQEKAFGLTNYDTYQNFAKNIEDAKKKTVDGLAKIKKQYNKIVGYGAPAKATTVLNYYGIDSTKLDYVVEDNPLKHNKLIPGVRIPIFSKEMLTTDKPDIILVMAWNFFEEIKKNNQPLIDSGIKFLSIKDLLTI